MVAEYVWAKSKADEDLWLPLWVHLEDTLNVAKILWKEWVPDTVRNLIAKDLKLSVNDSGVLLAWLAGIHDLGKVSPDFSGRENVKFMTEKLYSRMADQGFRFEPMFNSRGDNKTRYRHELVGCVLLDNGEAYGKASTFNVVIAGHHGKPQPIRVRNDRQVFNSILKINGDLTWGTSVYEIKNYIKSLLPEAEKLIEEVRQIGIPQRTQILLTSLVIMSDWLASTEAFFPLFPYNYVPSIGGHVYCNRYQKHVKDFNLLPRFTAPPLVTQNWLQLFEERFKISNPTLFPIQEEFYKLVNSVEIPEDLYILEAPMGEGKTEAALLGAEILNARTESAGVFFGLPTMATSEAIFSRMEQYLQNYSTITTPVSLSLNHSKSFLSEKYYKQKTSVAKNVKGVLPEGWLQGKHMRLLNPFVVGTIDSFLMLSLKIKYAYWRHLGFASKVIILDEVHSADSYMLGYLGKSLEWAGFYNRPVILLSATLTKTVREQLLAAYAKGKKIGEEII